MFAAISLDHRRLAVPDIVGLRVQGLVVYALDDGRRLAEMPGTALQGCFAPDASWLATWWSDGTATGPDFVELRDGTSGELVGAVACGQGEVKALAVSADGRLLAGAVRVGRSFSDGTGAVRVWAVASRTLEAELEGALGIVTAVAFSPDGRWLVGGGRGGLVVWEVARGEVARTMYPGERCERVVWSPDGRWLAVAGAGTDGEVRVLEAASWRVRWRVRGGEKQLRACAFWPEQEGLVCLDVSGTLTLWRLGEGEATQAWTRACGRPWVTSPDLRLLAEELLDRAWPVQRAEDGAVVLVVNPPDDSPQAQARRQRRDLGADQERVLRRLRQDWTAWGSAVDALDVLEANLEREEGEARESARALLGRLEKSARDSTPITTPFGATLLQGLKHPREAVRVRALEALRHAMSADLAHAIVEGAVGLLSDRDSAVRAAAAHRLWCAARRWPARLEPWGEALALASNDPDPNVAFFAQAARAWTRRAVGRCEARAGLRALADALMPDVSEPGAEVSGTFHVSHRRVHAPGGSVDDFCRTAFYDEASPESTQRRCGLCGGSQTGLVYAWSWADMTGSGWVDEILCQECGRYTVHQDER